MARFSSKKTTKTLLVIDVDFPGSQKKEKLKGKTSMNFKTLSVLAIVLLFAGVAVADMTVTVAASGGDFTTISDALVSNSSTGSNAAETGVFTVSIDPAGGPYDEAIDLDDANVGSGDFQASAIVIESSVAGTYVPIAVQLAPSGGANDGLQCHQDIDVTFRDLLIYPSLTNVFTDEMLKIDENAGSTNVDNLILVQHCIFTEIDASGNPLITDRAGAYADPPATVGSTRTGYAYFIQAWGDSGEAFDVTIDDCAMYGNIGTAGQAHGIRLASVAATDDYIINNTVVSGTSGACIRLSGVSGSTLTITGNDAGDGPDNATVLMNPDDSSDCFWIYSVSADVVVDISDTIFKDSSASWGINFSTDCDIELAVADCIFDTGAQNLNFNVLRDWTFDRCTFHTTGDDNALQTGGGAGSLAFRDCIFSGTGAKFAGTATPTGGIDIDYCAFPAAGPDAITSQDDGVVLPTYGSNIVTADPEYVSKDFTSADYFDLGNYDDYNGASSVAGFLAGGADVSIVALSVSVGDIPDVGIAPGSTSTPIDLDAYVSSPIYTDDQITWTFSGNTDVTVIQDGTSDPQTVAFTATGEVTETITATASDPDAGLPDDSDDIVVRSANLTITGSPDELVIATGECITCIIDLDDWIEVSAFADDEISWTYTGNSDVLVEIAAISATQPAHVRLELPTDATVGEDVPSSVDEVITFEGTDPNTDSDTEDLTMKKVKNYLDDTNYDFEWNGSVVNTAPIGWSASAVFFGGTSNTVTFGTSEDSYCGSYAGRINVSGEEGGLGATVAGLVSSESIAYGGTEPLQVGDTIALGMSVKRSQDQWFRIVFFRLGFGHFHLENLAATNTGPGSPTGWEKYVLYFTLPGPAGEFFWRIDNIAIDAQLATGDVELLVDNVTLVNYGAETLEDTKVAGAPIGITNKYFNFGTETETTIVGAGSGTAEWSSTDMPVGWNIASAIDQYQHVDTGYPQYAVVDASSVVNVDAANPLAAELVSKALDTSLPAGPALTINVAINDGTNAADPVDERSERHVLTFNYASPSGADQALFRAFVIAEDFSRSAEINVNSNYDAVVNRFRPFACHFAPQPWWPPSMIVPSAGVGNVIVRFDNISLLIGNVLSAAESTIWIDSAVLNVVQ